MNVSTQSTAPVHLLGLRCLRCHRQYPPHSIEYVCACRPNQGSDMGTLEVLYDYRAIQRAYSPQTIAQDPDPSIGRYWPLLPIAARDNLPPLAVGNTPLILSKRIGEQISFTPNLTQAFRKLFIKDDGRNPSASLKDRASAIAVTRAREGQRAVVATASTGNAAAALAAQSAAAGQPNVIFVPRSAPPAKIAQLLAYGSTVLAIDGSYDQAFDLCMEVCQAFGWYNRNTGYNPYMTEGKKTVAFEIAEQLARQPTTEQKKKNQHFCVPDAIFVAVGDGSIIGGVHKGFKELLALGWVEKMPRIYGVQSTQSAALYHAWRAGLEIPAPVQATTRADSISVDAPRDPVKALNAVRQTQGAYLAVPDEAILASILPLARLAAVFAEPAGATAYAGFLQAAQEGLVHPDETIVILNTGSGLKDIAAVMQVTGSAPIIEPTLAEVKKKLQL